MNRGIGVLSLQWRYEAMKREMEVFAAGALPRVEHAVRVSLYSFTVVVPL
jgi:hypothetical protein